MEEKSLKVGFNPFRLRTRTQWGSQRASTLSGFKQKKKKSIVDITMETKTNARKGDKASVSQQILLAVIFEFLIITI